MTLQDLRLLVRPTPAGGHAGDPRRMGGLLCAARETLAGGRRPATMRPAHSGPAAAPVSPPPATPPPREPAPPASCTAPPPAASASRASAQARTAERPVAFQAPAAAPLLPPAHTRSPPPRFPLRTSPGYHYQKPSPRGWVSCFQESSQASWSWRSWARNGSCQVQVLITSSGSATLPTWSLARRNHGF